MAYKRKTSEKIQPSTIGKQKRLSSGCCINSFNTKPFHMKRASAYKRNTKKEQYNWRNYREIKRDLIYQYKWAVRLKVLIWQCICNFCIHTCHRLFECRHSRNPLSIIRWPLIMLFLCLKFDTTHSEDKHEEMQRALLGFSQAHIHL